MLPYQFFSAKTMADHVGKKLPEENRNAAAAAAIIKHAVDKDMSLILNTSFFSLMVLSPSLS